MDDPEPILSQRKLDDKVLSVGDTENFRAYLTAIALSLLTVDRDLWNVSIHEE